VAVSFAINSISSLPSLRELADGLQAGFDPNSPAGYAGMSSNPQPRAALWFYTLDLQRCAATAAPTKMRESLACIRTLIEAGAHGFDPITGPGSNGTGFVASVLTASYLDAQHTDTPSPDTQALLDDTLSVVRLAVSRGASLDFGHSSGDPNLLGLLLNHGRGRLAAEALRMGTPTQCRFGNEWQPLELAQARCSPAGLALVTEALLERHLQMAQRAAANCAAEPAQPLARRRRAQV
jgi:hypothetical protein